MRLAIGDLVLRYPAAADAERLYALGSDERVTGWFSWGPYGSLAQAEQWIDRGEAARDGGTDLAFVIEKAGEGIVGVTSLNELSVRDRRAAVGTWIGYEWWGAGVNGLSKTAMAALAFDACRLRRLTAYANIENTRSAAALRRVGYSYEGTLRRWHRHGDQEFDVDVFSLLAEDDRGGEVEIAGEPPAMWVV